MIASADAPAVSAELPLVLDTNVCLDLFLFADSAVAGLHEQLRHGTFRAYYSDETREEWRRVLGYAVWKLDENRQQRLLDEFDGLLGRLDVQDSLTSGVALPTCRDSDDQKFLQLAAALPACVLLSKDRDLLKLARSCRRKLGFAILTPNAWAAVDSAAAGALYAELRQRRHAIANPGF